MSALRSVVFPDPVPPEFNNIILARTRSHALPLYDEQRIGWDPLHRGEHCSS